VLLNILSNAAKFSPAGSQIDVNAYANGDKLRIAVTDHGQGVPLAFQASIFQKFAQADSADTRKQGGTGLGLSISKQLIEQMSGTIGFTSQDGVGSTFFIELPQHHPTN
jgi:signal transduction histidine kinase